MDMPTEIVEAVDASTHDAPPARATRSAQRRRAAKVASDVAPFPAEQAAVVPDSGPVEAPSTPIVSYDPPATDMADTAAEDKIMDTIDTVSNTANDAADQLAGRGQAAFADMNGRAKEAMEKTSRMAEELGSFGKGNLEALVESSKIAAKGFETIGQEAAEFTRKQFETATAAMKTLAATRSPTEFMKLQSDYARSMFDAMVAETSKSTEMMLKLANDVAQPLSNRVAIAADKMKVAA